MASQNGQRQISDIDPAFTWTIPGCPKLYGSRFREALSEGLTRFELTFPDDTLVGFVAALDTVLILAIAARELAQHFIIAHDSGAIGKAPAEVDFLSEKEPVRHDCL